MEGAGVGRAIDVGLIAATCCIFMPTSGFGQERVRVTLPGETVVGVVTQLNPYVLELELPGGGSRMFSKDEVLRTERGFLRNRWHLGYLLGTVAGYATGVAVAYAYGVQDPEASGLWGFAAPLGLMAGGYVGFRLGASRKWEAWETVPGWTGDPVRVTLSDSERVEGALERITQYGLEVLLPGGPRLVAAGDVARFERPTVQRQWKRGFIVGAAAGGSIGLLLTPFGFEEDPSLAEVIGSKVLWVSTFGSFYGFLGAAVGGLFKREGWEPVQSWRRSAVKPRLLVGVHAGPTGNSSFLLGARLQL